MKPSKFNVAIATQDPGKVLIYNTLYRTAAILPAQHLALLGWGYDQKLAQHDLLRSLDGGGPGIQMIPPISAISASADTEQLSKLNFLVDDHLDEFLELDEFLARGYRPDMFCPVVALTAACNLDCVYCFEEGTVNRKDKMSEATSIKAIHWMERYIESHPELKTLSLGLFGGEPLLSLKSANFFIDSTKLLADRHGLAFNFGVTTNGTKLSRELIEDWVPRGLTFVRVTLDGPKDIHDKRRYFRSKKKTGSFDQILANLIAISDIPGFELEIEFNVDAQNFGSINDLLDVLEEAGLRERIGVVPEQTLDSLASSGKSTGCGSGGCSTCSDGETAHTSQAWFNKNSLAESNLTSAFVYVVEQIGKRGFTMPEMVGVYYPCIFVQRHHMVIDWHGDIYKCSFTIGNHEMRAGDIEQGLGENNRKMLDSVKTIDWCKSRNCAYIPICGGGCRYEAYNVTGSYNVPNCKADLIDAVLPRTVPYFFHAKPAERELGLPSMTEVNEKFSRLKAIPITVA